MAEDLSGGAPGAPADRRTAERVEILGALHGEVMVYQPMTILEIGPGGVTIETPFPLQLDSLHDFRLTLGERSLVAKGRIVHSRISDVDQERVTYRSGVEFVEPPSRVREAIAEFIHSVKSARQGG